MNLTITGIDQVKRRLAEMPSLLAAKGIHKAIDRAAGVIAAEVEARTPEGKEGLLKESVIVNSAVDLQRGGAAAAVGFSSQAGENGKPQDLIAFWVEYGHKQVSHGSKKSSRKVTGHVPAHPFMRPALDASGDRAIAVFAEVLLESLSEVGDVE